MVNGAGVGYVQEIEVILQYRGYVMHNRLFVPAGLAGVALIAAACGSSSTAGGGSTPSAAASSSSAASSPAAASSSALKTTTIKVSTHNSRYALSAKSAPRGVVIFKITNPASEPHDFSINGHTSTLLTTGQSTALRVTFHRKGRYSYKDTFDHHAQFGCRGGFRIT